MKDTDWRAEYVCLSDENAKLRELLDAKGLESACNAGTLSGCEDLLKAAKLEIERLTEAFRLYRERTEDGSEILFDRLRAANLQNLELLQFLWDLRMYLDDPLFNGSLKIHPDLEHRLNAFTKKKVVQP